MENRTKTYSSILQFSFLMRSITDSGPGNVRTFFFASDEWRGGAFTRLTQSHKTRPPHKTLEIIDRLAPRGQPQKIS